MELVIKEEMRKGLHIQEIDGCSFKLKAPFDFAFLSRYGRVFKVFDDQDSGNICFGTEKDGQKYFVKFAGAPTAEYSGTPEAAVERLKAVLPIYRDLKQQNLIELVGAEEIGGGFALVFCWADGDCMGRMYPEGHRRFMNLSISVRRKVFRDVLDFLAEVNRRGYVAADFYDGSILYDFENGKTTFCDIDLFRKKPCVNDMGRMWGSSSFMSPEEFELGAPLDEVTNVYTAGAMAFALFGGYSRTYDRWPLGEALYRVAEKATANDRSDRQPSVWQLIREWESAE
ncbi:MAG: serine/threonine protein kinase [Lachnospiraceae bacterium]|nr:serine/threonine protein kinase [Lachnospiraceae bacterium]